MQLLLKLLVKMQVLYIYIVFYIYTLYIYIARWPHIGQSNHAHLKFNSRKDRSNSHAMVKRSLLGGELLGMYGQVVDDARICIDSLLSGHPFSMLYNLNACA